MLHLIAVLNVNVDKLMLLYVGSINLIIHGCIHVNSMDWEFCSYYLQGNGRISLLWKRIQCKEPCVWFNLESLIACLKIRQKYLRQKDQNSCFCFYFPFIHWIVRRSNFNCKPNNQTCT